MRSDRRRATSSSSSRRMTAKVEAVNPCLRAFWEERDLPSGVAGPVERAALARLAASCFWEGVLVSRGMGPLIRDIAWGVEGFEWFRRAAGGNRYVRRRNIGEKSVTV